MKRIQKLFALVLTFALVLSLTVPALAADGHRVKITDKFDGHTYEAYQVFAGDYADGVLSNIKWGTGFNADKADELLASLKANDVFGKGTLNAFSVVPETVSNADLAEEIAKVVQAWGFDSPQAQEFAKVLHSYTKADDGTITYDYLTDVCTESDAGSPVIGNDGVTTYTYTIDDLASGYYLIKDQDGSLNGEYDYYTRLMLRVVGDLDIAPKGDVPTVDKKVHSQVNGTYDESEDVAITDTFYYKLTGTLPSNFESYESYEYAFIDTMSAGLDLDVATVAAGYEAFPGIVDITVERVSGAHVNLKLTTDPVQADETVSAANRYNLLLATSEAAVTDDTDVLITYTENADNTKTLVVKFLDLRKSLPGLIPSDKIVIKYAATLNENAVIGAGENGEGNVNIVVLEFSNNPQGDGTGKTPEDDAKVYTFELDINKVDETGTNKLADAEFLLYQRIPTAVDGVFTYRYAVLSLDDGVYTVDSWIDLSEPIAGESKDLDTYVEGQPNYALNAAGAQILVEGQPVDLANMIVVSTADAPVRIEGLDVTIYWLHELNAPAAYNKLDADVQITITATHDPADGTLKSLSVTSGSVEGASDITSGTVTITVQNTKGSTLPSTGGIGTTIFYLAGGLMVAAAVVLLITKKRMAKEA